MSKAQVHDPVAMGRDDSASLVLAEQAKSLPKTIREGGSAIDSTDHDRERQVQESCGKSTGEIFAMLTEAETQGKQFLVAHVNSARQRSYKAYRNEHFQGSKYTNETLYGARSKLFKPKTRGAVRKSQAAAGGALFASADVVTIEAQDNSNPTQRASADLKKELLNYRLERTNGRDSIPWFLVSMGAQQDAQIAGVCISKQYWKFRERPAGSRGTTKILADRPDAVNIPPENVILDPNCDWTRPAQTSAYFIIRYPMPIHEVRAMMRKTELEGQPHWFEIPEDDLLSLSGMTPDDVRATREARSGGADNAETAKAYGRYRIVWVYETFINIDGEDFTFWSVGNQRLLSCPMLTEEAHPHLFGERPIAFGYGAIETHRVFPMSPVESWQQLQQEANDVVNLRLDQMKQVVSPITKVKRGRQVDVDILMRRAPNTVVHVMDKDDVEWDRPPDVPPSAMAEGNVLNNDFDELAGVFSQSSVQSNRSLNETVGGMKLLNGNANALTEFDLRVWVETWVEPVLWQLVKLEEWYESDAKILALAGQKAGLVAKYGIDAITDQLLKEDITLRVAVGMGAADPMQGLQKFQTAATVAGTLLQPFVEAGLVTMRPKAGEIVDEVFGKAGYKGAADRFFEIQEGPPPQQTDPAAAKAQADLEKHKMTLADKEREREFKGEVEAAKLVHQEKLAREKHLADMERARLTELAQNDRLGREHSHKSHENLVSQVLDAMKTVQANREAAQAREHERQNASADRAHSAFQATKERGFKGEQSEADRKAKAAQAAAKPKPATKKAA